ncbi:MAG: hypothetical protein PHT78_07960 [Desulfitobacteriaceae bacterium]|nr:hypothetical protein [Desulfitobacteriaceae bacterium]
MVKQVRINKFIAKIKSAKSTTQKLVAADGQTVRNSLTLTQNGMGAHYTDPDCQIGGSGEAVSSSRTWTGPYDDNWYAHTANPNYYWFANGSLFDCAVWSKAKAVVSRGGTTYTLEAAVSLPL